jgi:predicted GIY-YIG superfamily endonuclease
MSASAPADSSSSSSPNSFFVYILKCADGSFYIGHSSDVEERVKVHKDGRGALWTACRRPVELVYQESHSTEELAIHRERQLKRWTHAKKVALISGNLSELKSLAKRRVY